ncbi:MAG TPA: CBS domain-containing protein, partial [Myxococcota bacterium]|nr:CBS domain-containing protein [Myxococcota bacterium]
MPKARDLMEERVVTVDAASSLLEVHRLFAAEGISGAPVVSDTEELEGVITNTDLVRAVGEAHDSAVSDSSYFRDLLPYSSPDWEGGPEDFQDRLSQLTVADFMARGVVSVGPDASAR